MSNDITIVSSTVAGVTALAGSDERRQHAAGAQQPQNATGTVGNKKGQADGGYPLSREADTNRERLVMAIDELRERLHTIRRTTLEFSIDDTTQKTVVKVIDKDKDEVILQLPSEQLLELAKFFAADDLDRPKSERGQPRGLLIDERA